MTGRTSRPHPQPRQSAIPVTPDIPPHLDTADTSVLMRDARLLESELVDAELADLRAPGVDLRASRLRKVDASGSQLAALSALDVSLHGCNLANVRLPKPAWCGCRSRAAG